MFKIPYLGINTSLVEINNNEINLLYELLKKAFEYGINHIYIDQNIQEIYIVILKAINFSKKDRTNFFITINVKYIKDLTIIEKYSKDLQFIDLLIYDESKLKLKNKILNFNSFFRFINNSNLNDISIDNCIFINNNIHYSKHLFDLSIKSKISIKNIYISQFLQKNMSIICKLDNFDDIIDFSKSLNQQKFINLHN